MAHAPRTTSMTSPGDTEMTEFFFPADGDRPAVTIVARSLDEATAKLAELAGSHPATFNGFRAADETPET